MSTAKAFEENAGDSVDRNVEELRVLWVSPKPDSKAAMIFIERQIESLLAAGVIGRTFHLQSRTSPVNIFQELRRFYRELRDFGPHIVHAQYGTVTALFCALGTTRPLFITFRGSDLNPNPWKHRLRCLASRAMSQVAALRARKILCVSGQLVERLWWARGKAVVVPSGIDTQTFCPRPKAEARARLGWNADELVVFFNGANRNVKRPDLARAAVAVASQTLGAVRFFELDGSQMPDDIPWMMNASDCLIMTSDHEGSPNVVKEAIACGLPVVSRDIGDVRERLADVHPSKVVGDTPVELGAALVEILSAGVRSNGPQVAAEFSIGSIAERIIGLYESAMHGRCAVRKKG